MDAHGASNSGGDSGGGGGGGGETVVVDSGRRRSSCGYCSSSSFSSISHGVWAYSLTAHAYQDLLDRGWRRSGCYLYKPEMERTCCPQYTIRLKANDFVPSKEQDRVLKKMERFLDGTLGPKIEKSKDNKKLSKNAPNHGASSSLAKVSKKPEKELESLDEFISLLSEKINIAINSCFGDKFQIPKTLVKKVKSQMKRKLKEIVITEQEQDLLYTSNISFQIAASIRQTKSKNGIEKLESESELESVPVSPNIVAEQLAGAIPSIPGFITKACNGHLNFYSNTIKPESRETFSNKPLDSNQNNENTPRRRRKLEIRMNQSAFDPDEFALYEKYQTLVHNDKRVTKDSYVRFLVDTPIPFIPPKDGDITIPSSGFGSFHQQYLIDGKIIAVGVVDILPKCLSSKYLFWDPDFAFLSLGKFSALKEINWVREMRNLCPRLEYYYLGYYIHSCSKMRYKAKYRPSELLCPLRYEWVPYDIAAPLLDKSKYVVLSDFTSSAKHERLLHQANSSPPASSADWSVKQSGAHKESLGHEDEEEEEEENDFMYEDSETGLEDQNVISEDLRGENENIREIMIDLRGTRVKYKDLENEFNVKRRFIIELEKQLHQFLKVVGKDLARRIVYSLG